jgi:hypothetical protein
MLEVSGTDSIRIYLPLPGGRHGVFQPIPDYPEAANRSFARSYRWFVAGGLRIVGREHQLDHKHDR